jgi:hypothetical protein
MHPKRDMKHVNLLRELLVKIIENDQDPRICLTPWHRIAQVLGVVCNERSSEEIVSCGGHMRKLSMAGRSLMVQCAQP